MPARHISARTRRAAGSLGAHCAEWRKLQSLTAEQTAQRAGVSRPTLARLESGDPGVGLDVFLDVARSLGFLNEVIEACDPFQTDLGKARAAETLPKRVRN